MDLAPLILTRAQQIKSILASTIPIATRRFITPSQEHRLPHRTMKLPAFNAGCIGCSAEFNVSLISFFGVIIKFRSFQAFITPSPSVLNSKQVLFQYENQVEIK